MTGAFFYLERSRNIREIKSKVAYFDIKSNILGELKHVLCAQLLVYFEIGVF